jgi:hypothetical protein
MLDLKICSVSFNSYEYLRINRAYMTPQVDWLVISNKQGERVPDGFETMEGVPPIPPNPSAKIGYASYHHAAALNKACRSGKLDKRYILFLDPDFFILPSLERCIKHMEENNLAFFGAPYAIEPTKLRLQDFPVAFCMFVDSTQVDVENLDFSPQEHSDIVADTGYNIYKQYISDGKLGWDSAVPHFAGDTHYPRFRKSIKDLYGIASEMKMDQYFWEEKLFGIHFHMKLHLRNDSEVINRSVAHTREVISIIKTVRKYDTTI